MLHVCGYIYHHSPTFFWGKCGEAFSIPGVLRHDIAPPNRPVAETKDYPDTAPKNLGNMGSLGWG